MHRSDNVTMSIVVNGNEQKIINGKVYIPFDTEYAIRIQNSRSARISVQFTIDGKETQDKFIVDPYQTVTFERFLSGNLKSGPRFKFVSECNDEVDNRGNSLNGYIQAKVCLEEENKINDFEKLLREIQPYQPYKPCPYELDDWYDWYYPKIGKTSITWLLSTDAQLSCNFSTKLCERGATIGGSESNQTFSYVDDLKKECRMFDLSLQLLPSQTKISSNKFCTNCGQSIKSTFKYCPKCGISIIN